MLTRFLLRAYDYFTAHSRFLWAILLFLVIGSTLSLLRLSFREDIADFLPRDPHYRRSVSVYQNFNTAEQIFFFFQLRDTAACDPQRIVDAIEYFIAVQTRRVVKSLA